MNLYMIILGLWILYFGIKNMYNIKHKKNGLEKMIEETNIFLDKYKKNRKCF